MASRPEWLTDAGRLYLLVGSALLLCAGLLAGLHFYLSLPALEQTPDPSQWQQPQLIGEHDLRRDLDRLSTRSLWGRNTGSGSMVEADATDRSWQLLGIVNQEDDYVICWVNSSRTIVRLAEGDTIVEGVKVVAIAENSMTYRDDVGEHQLALYAPSSQVSDQD